MRESIENPLEKSRVFDLGKKEIYRRRRKTKTFGVFVNKYGGLSFEISRKKCQRSVRGFSFLIFFYFFPTLDLRQMNRAPTEYLRRCWFLGKDGPFGIVWNFPLEFEDSRVQKITAVQHKTTNIYIYSENK